jgi:hypothetical protein
MSVMIIQILPWESLHPLALLAGSSFHGTRTMSRSNF